MIIVNGYISGIILIDAVKNEFGNSAESTEKVCRPIPCNFKPVKNNLLALTSEGNSYKNIAYEILIELQKFAYERAILTDEDGTDLGTFPVKKSPVKLKAVNATKILLECQ